MGQTTDIEWCDSTVNPTMGCDGCELWSAKEKTCYAGILHERYGGVNKGFSPTFDQLTFYPGRTAKAAAWSDMTGKDRPDKPWLNGRPRHIFISDMSDALSKAVAFEYLKTEIIDVVNSPKGRRHVWMWLTKQAARMAEFSDWLKSLDIGWPSNLWAGASITRQATISRIYHLTRVGDISTTRFVSAEPLFEDVNLRLGQAGFSVGDMNRRWIHLVIAGGESGRSARPCNVAWIRSIVEQCKAAGVACFVKQLGSNPDGGLNRCPKCGDVDTDECRDVIGANDGNWFCNNCQNEFAMDTPFKLTDGKGGCLDDFPSDLRIRQFPAPALEHAR